MTGRRTIRCAIYTRKSFDEGLEQGFYSPARRQRPLRRSQTHEGWRLVANATTTWRVRQQPGAAHPAAPAGHIDARRIEIVVVYKIDRSTRALTDFVRLVERFAAAGCSFVSVTHAFNTVTLMGRLTASVLLSFAPVPARGYRRAYPLQNCRFQEEALDGRFVPLRYRLIAAGLV